MKPIAEDPIARTFPRRGRMLKFLPESVTAEMALSEKPFKRFPPWPLAQPWRESPDPDFQRGRVWVGLSDHCFVMRAELADVDIFNPESRFNEPAFLLGDVFEMFIRPPGQKAYFEFHVSPANQCLQLRIPSREAFLSQREEMIPEDWKISDLRIETATRIQPTRQRWFVGANIPIPLLLEGDGAKVDGVWKMSFCRYDYSRGRAQPVLSSTSPHPVCNFHRQEEWTPLHLSDRPTGSESKQILTK